MNKIAYCIDCKRIFNFSEQCPHCNSSNLKELVKKAPVNVLGTKLKGRFLKAEGEMLNILFYGEGREKTIRKYEASQLQKVL